MFVRAEEEFEGLYHSYYMKIYSYIMTIMKNSHQAEEITQEVFYKALKTDKKHRGQSSEFTWLCTIAKNTCMDMLRKQKHFEELNEEIPSDKNIEQSLEDEAMTLEIHQILHQLEEPYKEVFSLRVFGELSFQKIGQIFEKTETWARVTYHRARLKIQEKMEEKHG